MPIVDGNGRLLGRINLVDAAALAALLVLLPIGVATYRVFRVHPPEILKIEPGTMLVEGEHRLRIDGNNLRPYMHAFIASSGQAPAFVDLPENPNEAAFLLERPTLAYVRLPVVKVGTYDLYLYDEGREVLRRASAFTVVAPDTPRPRPVAAPPSAMLDIVLRADVTDELVPLIKVGDVDTNVSKTWGLKPGVITAIRRVSDSPRLAVLQVGQTGGLSATLDPPRARVELTVRAGVQSLFGTWEYDNRRRIRAGQALQFLTGSYALDGVITRVAVVPGLAAERPVGRP